MKNFNIVILHGTFSNPSINWFPWLKEELIKLECKVFTPQFPTPKDQTVENWIKVLDNVVPSYDQHLILIGHSSSPMVICAKLQELQRPISASFFVAPFLGTIGLGEYDKANADFNSFNYDWKKIRKMSKFYIYRSNNDPYVPEKYGKVIAEKLGIKEITIPNGKHLNTEAGYTKFPQLLEDIKKEILTIE